MNKTDEEVEKEKAMNIYAGQGSNVNVGDNNKIQNSKKGLVGEVVEKVSEAFLG